MIALLFQACRGDMSPSDTVEIDPGAKVNVEEKKVIIPPPTNFFSRKDQANPSVTDADPSFESKPDTRQNYSQYGNNVQQNGQSSSVNQQCDTAINDLSSLQLKIQQMTRNSPVHGDNEAAGVLGYQGSMVAQFLPQHNNVQSELIARGQLSSGPYPDYQQSNHHTHNQHNLQYHANSNQSLQGNQYHDLNTDIIARGPHAATDNIPYMDECQGEIEPKHEVQSGVLYERRKKHNEGPGSIQGLRIKDDLTYKEPKFQSFDFCTVPVYNDFLVMFSTASGEWP